MAAAKREGKVEVDENRLLTMISINHEMGICYYFVNDGILRHTGIFIKFLNRAGGGVTSFTIDIEDVGESTLAKLQCVFWECRARIAIYEVTRVPTNYEISSNVRIFLLDNRANINEARCYVCRLFVPTSKSYQLFFNNCRHHAEQALNNLCCDNNCHPEALKKARSNIAAKRQEDGYMVLRIIGFGFGVGVAVAAVAAVATVAGKYLFKR